MRTNADPRQLSAAGLIGRYRGAIMGTAAFMIVLFHCWIPQIPLWPVLGNVEALVKQYGYIGVDIFFFLSGLGMTYAIRKERIFVFYGKRIRRTLFPYIVMALVGAVMEKWSSKWLMMICSGYAFYRVYIYSFLWFVPAILTLYALYPLYHGLLDRARLKTAFVVNTMLIVFLIQLLLKDVLRVDFWGFINRIPVFCMGILFGEEEREQPLYMGRAHWIGCVLVFAAGCVLMAKGAVQEHTLLPVFNSSIPAGMIAVTLCLMMAGAFHMIGSYRCLQWIGKPVIRILTFLGTFTLELYCVQELLYGRIFDLLKAYMSHFMINWVAIALIIAAGYALYVLHGLFWLVVDRAMHTWRRNS